MQEPPNRCKAPLSADAHRASGTGSLFSPQLMQTILALVGSLDPLRCGLIPYWCDDPTGGRKTDQCQVRDGAGLRCGEGGPFFFITFIKSRRPLVPPLELLIAFH